MYDLTQEQRAMERAIRKTKRRLVAKKAMLDAATGEDRDKVQAEYNALSDKLAAQNKAYNEFCAKNGLVPQYDRTRLADFTREQSDAANAAMKGSGETAERSTPSEQLTIAESGGIIKIGEKVELAEVTDAKQSDIASTTAEKKQAQKLAAETLTKLKSHSIIESEVREAITSRQLPIELNPEKQARHMVGTAPESSSVITISTEELQEIISSKAGTGKLTKTNDDEWNGKEIIDAGKIIGYTVNRDKVRTETTCFKIHYSSTGVHVVPCLKKENEDEN